MDEKWRIGRVSTPERIFEKLLLRWLSQLALY